MDWKSETRNDAGLYKVPKRWLHIHYYEALNILFRFENSLRMFVYIILKNEFLEEWDNCSFSVGDNDSRSIRAAAAQRRKQAASHGYLGYEISAPLMHLTSGELVELMTSDAYWKYFKCHFRGAKDIMKNKLFEIGTIRNSLAHFRPIKKDDIELVKQNSRHTLTGIEECLANVCFQDAPVPTNTTDDWYKSLNTIGTEQVFFLPFYSKNEDWISVRLVFRTVSLSRNSAGNQFYSYTLVKLKTPNILKEFPKLKKFVTCVSEELTYPSLNAEYEIDVTKNIDFVFRKDVLADNHEEISSQFTSVVQKISEECELLEQDSGARGKIAETARVYASWYAPENADGRWNFGHSALSQEETPDDPVEYWGGYRSSSDVVAGSVRYPWMPEEISEKESIFD